MRAGIVMSRSTRGATSRRGSPALASSRSPVAITSGICRRRTTRSSTRSRRSSPGRARSLSCDRSLATVLFTDIVGGTAKAAALGDRAWRELLERHYAVIREQLRRYRGMEVDTAGDGFFATFDGPARAVRAAISSRDAVRSLGLEIRAGAHTGECERIAEKVGGIAVMIAARVREQASAGEVLVSSTVRVSPRDPACSSRTEATTRSKAFPANGSSLPLLDDRIRL